MDGGSFADIALQATHVILNSESQNHGGTH